MTFQGAVVREQGVSFAVVVVKEYVLSNSSESERAIWSFAPHFPGLPIILMAQDWRGTPKYFGRKDIVNFLASIDFRRIPWRQYTLT